VAGTFAGLLVAWVANGLEVTNRTDPVIVAIVSAVASVASQMGDLAESALKRRFDVKDSSHLIPGHGGVMDRLDGFWAVAVLIGLILLADTLMPR
jgi:phosphatidate cytidylyltransferase